METARKYLKTELKDGNYKDLEGNTDWGGISFRGETLKDFIDEDPELNYDSSLYKVNQILRQCNIKKIKKNERENNCCNHRP